jgi:hypothetical protein
MTHPLIEGKEGCESKASPGVDRERSPQHRKQTYAFPRPEATFDWMDQAQPFRLNDGDVFLS